MNGVVKKVLAALAIKEGIQKIQEMRQPKRSLISRLTKPAFFLALAGGAVYLQQTGQLAPLAQKAKGLAGGSSSAPAASESTATFASSSSAN
jgi:uncharacterized protein GlcG (DUF336 family)